MELKQYWNVIWKRRWLVLAIVALVALASGAMLLTSDRSYETDVWFITRQDNTEGTAARPVNIEGQVVVTFDENYYRWFGSEFLVDDYTQITESDAFAASVLETMRDQFFPNKVMEDLNNQAQAEGLPMRGEPDAVRLGSEIARLSAGDVKNAIASDRRHRELHLTITASSAELVKGIADASAIVLTEARIRPVRGEMFDDNAVFTQIERVGMQNIASSRSRDILNAVIRVIVGLVAALALAFLLEYLDDSVRDERDARRVLDVPVIGAIPRG
jgi:capsular polysaccharide biosynthesis protein